jgi:hypothetical protein
MSAKRKTPNALQAVLDRQVAATVAIPANSTESAAPLRAKRQSQKITPAASEASSSHHRPSRAGKRLIGGHFPPDTAKHLKILAAEEETSVQALLEEALELLFVKKGKGRIGRT